MKITPTDYFPADFTSEEREVLLPFGEYYIVRAARMIGTPIITISAFQKIDSYGAATSIFRSAEHGLLGRVGSIGADFPAAIEALPLGSPERIEACETYFAAKAFETRRAIRAAFGQIDFEPSDEFEYIVLSEAA